MSHPIAQIRALRKVYPGRPAPVVAVDGIDLDIAQGELFGLLGPNGAGKTTTIGICTTRTLPTAGQVVIAGMDVVRRPADARVHLGVVPQYNTLDRSLTVFENLLFHCRYFGMSAAASRQRAQALLVQFQLADRGRAFPSQLSGGLQQRVQIARAIAHHPAVLFLDEPSAGLDPQSRLAMWDAVKLLQNEGITVILTTHYMEEADALCGRVAIVDKGRVLALDTPAALKRAGGAHTRIELKLREMQHAAALLARLEQMPGVARAERSEAGLRVYTEDVGSLLPPLVQAAQQAGLRDLTLQEPSLETAFLQLTGRALRD